MGDLLVGSGGCPGPGRDRGVVSWLVASALFTAGCGAQHDRADAAAGEAPAAAAETQGWVRMGGDLASTFHNTRERVLNVDNAAELKMAWRFETSGAPTSTPAVVDGIVYLQSGGAAYALRIEDGSVLWKNTVLGGTSSPAYHDGYLYLNDARAELYRLDAQTGEVDWHVSTDDHPNATGTSSPVVVEDMVIVGTSSGEEGVATDASPATFRGAVVAYDIADGTERWRYSTAQEPFNGATVWSTVSVDLEERLVFATTGNNYTGTSNDKSDAIIAIDLDDGAERWVLQTTRGDVYTIRNQGPSDDTDFGANPILYEAEIDGKPRKMVAAGQKSGIVYGVDRLTGEMLWSRELGAMGFTRALTGGVLNNGAFDGTHLLVASNTATSTGEGSEEENGESGVGQYGAFILPHTSVLYALDPATGEVVWERQLPAWVWGPITVAGGVGFVPVEMQLEAFDVATGEKIARHQTAGTIASGASVVDGRVFFGSGMSYIEGTFNNAFHMLSIHDELAAAVTTDEDHAARFSIIYQEIIVGAGCATAYCHGDATAGGLDLSSPGVAYAQLLDVPAAGDGCAAGGAVRVVAGDPDASLLLDKIGGSPACGDNMPPTSMLDGRRVEQVRQWIVAGALDD